MLLFLKTVESFSGCYCPISFEWFVWVQRCVSLVDDSSGVCVCRWFGGCIWVRVEEGMAERACLVVGYSFDY